MFQKENIKLNHDFILLHKSLNTYLLRNGHTSPSSFFFFFSFLSVITHYTLFLLRKQLPSFEDTLPQHQISPPPRRICSATGCLNPYMIILVKHCHLTQNFYRLTCAIKFRREIRCNCLGISVWLLIFCVWQHVPLQNLLSKCLFLQF